MDWTVILAGTILVFTVGVLVGFLAFPVLSGWVDQHPLCRPETHRRILEAQARQHADDHRTD